LTCALILVALRSFPTRRSSDLGRRPVARRGQGVRRTVSRGADLQRQTAGELGPEAVDRDFRSRGAASRGQGQPLVFALSAGRQEDRKSTRLNSSHDQISYAVFC